MKNDLTNQTRLLSRKIKALRPNWWPTLILIICSIFFIENHSIANPLIDLNQIKKIPPKEIVFIDTRPYWKFLWGHIPGAINLSDWKKFTQKKGQIPGLLIQDKSWIVSQLKSLGLDHSKSIILYGDPTDKWRTDGRFFWMLEYYGFKRVFLLKGGFNNWKQGDFPIERGKETKKIPSNLKKEDLMFNSLVYADQKWIQKRLNSPKFSIIDNRELTEYEGATPYGSPRGGHIPGAIHIDWRDFFNNKGAIKPKEVLYKLLQEYKIKTDHEIVVYCTGGVRSAMAYFVFRYLGFKVRNYDGSWWDWSNNFSLPVES